jgi:hypothetical protein
MSLARPFFSFFFKCHFQLQGERGGGEKEVKKGRRKGLLLDNLDGKSHGGFFFFLAGDNGEKRIRERKSSHTSGFSRWTHSNLERTKRQLKRAAAADGGGRRRS